MPPAHADKLPDRCSTRRPIMSDGSLPGLPTLPIAVIGAGPVGLAAAAHVRAPGLTPLMLEAGPEAGTAVKV